jgi:hypothetical protein
MGLTPATVRRPDDMTNLSDPAVLYVLSYLLIRTVVGVIGIVLPFILIFGEAIYLANGVHIQGSLSVYYHSSMRDFFVAGLCVVGFLLATYMSGLTKTWDFWLSLVAGVAVLGVVFFPTGRPGLVDSDARCGATPMPPGCAPIQQQLGEKLVATIHFSCAIVFILSLAVIAFLFAYREKTFENDVKMARLQKVFGWVIIGAVVFVVVGGLMNIKLWEFTPLYLGEVVSVWAFGVSWFLKGKDLRGVLGLGRRRAALAPPVAAELGMAGPAMAGSVVAEPMAAQHAAAGPVVAGPAVAEPAVTEPAVSDQ